MYLIAGSQEIVSKLSDRGYKPPVCYYPDANSDDLKTFMASRTQYFFLKQGSKLCVINVESLRSAQICGIGADYRPLRELISNRLKIDTKLIYIAPVHVESISEFDVFMYSNADFVFNNDNSAVNSIAEVIDKN